jgi:hypothetical protein
MDPATATLIGTVVGYLVKKVKESKSFKEFTNEFTDATVNWLRPIFLTPDDKPNKTLTDLQQNPDDEINQSSVSLEIAKAVRDNTSNFVALQKLVEEIEKKGDIIPLTSNIIVKGDKNIVVGPITGNSGEITIEHNNTK